MVDISRGTTGIVLPKAVSQEIWQNTQEQSLIQRLVPSMPLPGGGVDVPIITGDPVAAWTAETAEKPVSRSTFGSKNIKGYTLAVIEPFSNQFRRDLPALYGALVQRLPLALARTFDRTALGFQASPGSGFDTLAAAPSVSLASVPEDPGPPVVPATTAYDGFLGALSSVATNGGDLSAWALSTQAEIAALGSKDAQGRPLFLESVTNEGTVTRVLGRPVTMSKNVYDTTPNPDVLGFGGDWQSARWGYVEGIKVDIADQATLNDGGTPLNLWQRNMFAVRVEFEIGFVVRDVNRFVKLTA